MFSLLHLDPNHNSSPSFISTQTITHLLLLSRPLYFNPTIHLQIALLPTGQLASTTIKQKDGGVGTSTMEVTVTNAPPTIEELTGDTSINQGESATFSALASDYLEEFEEEEPLSYT